MNISFDAGQTRLYLGLYEVELSRHFRRLCQPGYRSFDVGGQYGYDALAIGKLTGAEVVSLECDPLLCDIIKRNIELNPGYTGRIQVREAFVTDVTTAGTAMLTLDDLATSSFIPDFIKMDIEGAELDALRGAETILAERRPGLLVEVHSLPLEHACCQLLERHGYRWTVVNPRRWLPDYRPIPHNRWVIAEGRHEE